MSLLAILITFSLVFVITFWFSCGGINNRIRYAYKVSDSLFGFFKNYSLSYFLKYEQIKNSLQFFPEVSAKMEKIIAHGLSDEVGAGRSTNSWDDDVYLRIQRSNLLGGPTSTVEFRFEKSMVDDVEYLLSPTVFLLAKKLEKKIVLEKEAKKAEKQRNSF